jgi:DNA-binding NarL/FixJ family response regulator
MTDNNSNAAAEKPVRVVLVDDDEIIIVGLQAMLARHNDKVNVVGVAFVTEDVLSKALNLKADVVLLDTTLHQTSGLDLVEELVAEKPPFRVVIFTDDGDERRLFEALRLGVSGYLLKSLTAAQLADHLVLVANGQVIVDPTMATRIAKRAAHVGDNHGWPGSQLGLSQRESQVLGLLVEGMSNRLIAAQLVVGEETVKTHLRSIYRKLGVNDRAHAIATVLRQGIFA